MISILGSWRVADGNGAARQPTEQVDISVTHWAGQYVPPSAWPRVCGPDGYTDPPVTDATGKDCNVFDGVFLDDGRGPRPR